jgi:hypothetical protein
MPPGAAASPVVIGSNGAVVHKAEFFINGSRKQSVIRKTNDRHRSMVGQKELEQLSPDPVNTEAWIRSHSNKLPLILALPRRLTETDRSYRVSIICDCIRNMRSTRSEIMIRFVKLVGFMK